MEGAGEWMWGMVMNGRGRGQARVGWEAGIGKGESGTSVHTGRPRKGALWSQGRLWLLSEGLCGPRSRHWRCSQRAGSKREFRKTRGFFWSKGGKRRGGKLRGKEVRGLVMVMALVVGEESTKGQRALPVPRFNRTALACLQKSLCMQTRGGQSRDLPTAGWTRLTFRVRATPFHFPPRWKGSRSVLSNMAAASHIGLMSTWNTASLRFCFGNVCFISIHSNSHVCPVTTGRTNLGAVILRGAASFVGNAFWGPTAAAMTQQLWAPGPLGEF